ncbi:hypothetical protein O181_014464 [Austropuccinia psidii MF-1]|uniref:Uncharacterized protein n=1 Tax=Austropuccinia psidii MF-1 TaxID=1389203 RepID=A0A9Q3BY60_9BASI|nr:hypothetical protein [Austropuccinia psidii MF-1]
MSEGERARLGEVEDEEGEESVEEEDSGNQSLVSQSDPSVLKVMEQMATIMGQISQAASPREDSKAPAFKTP